MTISQETSTPIELAVVDGIATLTLNRPEARNAISDAMRSLLIEHLEQIAADPAIKALVVTGSGKGFCAGGDIKGMQARMSAPAGSVAARRSARRRATGSATRWSMTAGSGAPCRRSGAASPS